MERQRSFGFTLKFTKFWIFSLILSFSVILLTFFSIWFIQATPQIDRQVTLRLDYYGANNYSAPSPSLPPVNFQSLKGSAANFSEPSPRNLTASNTSHIVKTPISSGFQESSSPVEVEGRESGENLPQPYVNSQETGIEVPDSKKVIEDVMRKVDLRVRDVGEVNVEDGKLTRSIHNSVQVKTKSNDRNEGFEDCDISEGKWVFDDSYPLYTNLSCPFIDEGFNCQRNGRLDKEYLKWRWQPKNCNIARFNATKMLELIRGKRLVFVGDSINRNQWESMLCLLLTAVKDPKRVYETHGRKITKQKGNYSFKFLDYRCTVEFYVSHYLVHEGTARIGRKRKPTLRIDRVDRGSSRWKGADILIFNTANWWSHSKTRAGIYYYQEGDQVHPRLDVLTAFGKAMKAWASWVDAHINPRKTQVFFRSYAPAHFRGGQWNTGGHCGEAKGPLQESYIEDAEKDTVTMSTIQQMRSPVAFLNVTGLSSYRIDGHPSIYGKTSATRLGIQDCSHWCLPGVPDTWNQLLYHHLLFKQSDRRHPS